MWVDMAAAQPLGADNQCFLWQPGIKVFLGDGPEISDRTDWVKFIPASVPGLVVVKDVDVKYWRGAVCHIEAGG